MRFNDLKQHFPIQKKLIYILIIYNQAIFSFTLHNIIKYYIMI